MSINDIKAMRKRYTSSKVQFILIVQKLIFVANFELSTNWNINELKKNIIDIVNILDVYIFFLLRIIKLKVLKYLKEYTALSYKHIQKQIKVH